MQRFKAMCSSDVALELETVFSISSSCCRDLSAVSEFENQPDQLYGYHSQLTMILREEVSPVAFCTAKTKQITPSFDTR